MSVQHSFATRLLFATTPSRRNSEYAARPIWRGLGHGLAVALVPLGLALALAAPIGAAHAEFAKPFDLQNGVRVYRGPDFTTSFEPAPAPPADRGLTTTPDPLDPMVEWSVPARRAWAARRRPIARAGYRIRCPSVGSNSCARSQVFVEIPKQPLVQHSGFGPGTLVRFGTAMRDGKLLATVRITQRGVRVHRAGLRDDLRVVTHKAGGWSGSNIKVHGRPRAGGWKFGR